MRKALSFIRACCLAMLLCAIPLSRLAAADDGPTATPIPRVGPVDLPLRSLAQAAPNGRVLPFTAPAVADAGPTASPAPRAAPAARSYPRGFTSYDALIDYAKSAAAAQRESDDRLVALMARQDTAVAALEAVFDPRVRGGLVRARTDLMDDATLSALWTQIADDAATGQQLVADGAVTAPAGQWRLPVLGEDTQDFGPTPYYFEPAMTYRGVYYPHFHDGTDIAVAWGTPVLAPARGVVVFAGTMGDGAVVVAIAHDNGLVSMYAHLENRVFPEAVKAGDKVQAGDRIGNVGLTGMTTGTHLHWSVWRNGELIDPLSMIGSSRETGTSPRSTTVSDR